MNYQKLIPVLFLLCIMPFLVTAQNLSQTIRGTVVDKVSISPIPGAQIFILNSNPIKGTTSDSNGYFKLTGVPVGEQTLKIRVLGYKDYTASDIVVNSGKEVVLNISLEENIIEGHEVVITSKIEKNKALNEMSVVSTRTFSVEETQKYAAAVNDPLRMATAFPGVIQTSDGNNNVSIRGNSPNGLLWRMEGVDIPNPNHFSNVGTSGGGISILSTQLLTNSDFSTGAFAAEYGNALSGVFDLKLRKGNNEKSEYTFQAGLLGIDASAEGPFKKGYAGSYLVNYRYSTLSLLGKLGINFGSGITNFQDISFNFFMPTRNIGNFELFGFGGLSSQVSSAIKDTSLWVDEKSRQNSNFFANTGVVALTNTYILSPKSYIKSALAFSGTQNGFKFNELDRELLPHDKYAAEYIQKKITLSSTINNKISSRHSIRSGIIIDRIEYSLSEKQFIDSINVLREFINSVGTAFTLQAFSQWQYHITEKLSTNLGMHYFHFFLNGSNSIEPRASVKYELSSIQSLSFGYGLHSQLQPIGSYFIKISGPDGSTSMPAKDLGFSKAQHFVLGYDITPLEFLHFKIETYYQALYNIPVSTDPVSNFSMVNFSDGSIDPKIASHLVNKGLGRNYGAELTLEHYTYKNFYALASISVYDSKYQADNGNWYNTRYNGNFGYSLTTGKEFKLKKNLFSINIKSIYAGGLRRIPLNEPATLAAGAAIYEYDKIYAARTPAYFRTDVKFSIKHNYAKATGTISLDVQNVTDRLNYGGEYFDKTARKIKLYTQAGLIPVLSYRLEF